MRVAVGALVVGLVCAACSSGGTGDAVGDDSGAASEAAPETGPETGPETVQETAEYLPGLAATVDRPVGDPSAVVVLVPGGSWRTADPAGLLPLADGLAQAGYAVVTITYGTDSTGAHHPRPLQDVTCAVGFAADQVPDVPVVVVGHSAGANLALLAGLHPDLPDPQCPFDHVAPSGVVGLAGPYDVAGSGIGRNLFSVSPADDPQAWADGDPYTWAAERPEVPVLLVHGEADDAVPVFFTEDMAGALTDGGHPVRVELVPEVDHLEVFGPDVLLGPLTDWLAGLPGA